MSGKGSTLLGWLAIGGGIVLVYAAYRNRSPLDLLGSTLRGEAGSKQLVDTPSDMFDWVGTDGPVLGTGAGTRPSLLAGHKINPTWAPVPYQPTQFLDVCAIGPLMAAVAEYGRPIILTGSKRTEEEQADGYAADPSRFAPPGHSLHPVGLAIDVSSTLMDLNDPKLYAALIKHGWYRRGKVLTNGQPEPWHYSYGVPG